MTDLEMTRLCAEAMRITLYPWKSGAGFFHYGGSDANGIEDYDPLHDDAQAMALDGWMLSAGLGFVFSPNHASFYWQSSGVEIYRALADMTQPNNRRRARCTCVAQMQAAKEKS